MMLMTTTTKTTTTTTMMMMMMIIIPLFTLGSIYSTNASGVQLMPETNNSN